MGSVDLSNASDVQAQLLDEVSNQDLGVIVDLSSTRYLDSAGVHLLFDLAGRLRSRGQWLNLVVPESSRLRRVLQLTQIERVVPIHGEVQSAL